MVDVALVAVEELVGALADLHDDRPRLARQSRDEVLRHRRPVRQRLVLVEDELGHELAHRRLVDEDLVMVGAEVARHHARVVAARRSARGPRGAVEYVRTGTSVSSAISATLVEESRPPERKTPNGTSDIMRLRTDSRSRWRTSATISGSLIAATSSETAAGGIGSHHVRRCVWPCAVTVIHSPAPSFEMPAEHRARRRREPERQVGGERLLVEVARRRRMLEDRLDLGAEEHALRQQRVVQRLDAEPIAGEEELAPARVPDREGEHPVQALDARGALLLVEVDDRLGVGRGPEAVPARLEPGAQLAVVVDLAVVGDPDRPVLVGHRLMAGGREVDDREPPMAERDALLRTDARAARRPGPRWRSVSVMRATIGSSSARPSLKARMPAMPHTPATVQSARRGSAPG